MREYDGGGKKKGKGGHCLRFRDKNEIEDHQRQYKGQNNDDNNGHDDDDDDDDDDGDWDDMEEKEREAGDNDDDEDDDLVFITMVQSFGMTNNTFIGKEIGSCQPDERV